MLEEALDLHRTAQPPDTARQGRTLRLLAAVYLIAGEPEHAAETAREAVRLLRDIHAPDDTADAYRTLGRALWRMGKPEEALEAFVSEVDFAQSMPDRDEMRIGTALHHAADAYRATGNQDRAVANYRRALSHKNANVDPTSYFVTQLALHRALVEANRLPTALDVAQEIIDLLVRQPQPDLVQYGYAQAVRARTEQAAQRPIRAAQSFADWTRVLTTRAAEAAADPRPAVQTLILGLTVRSLLADSRPALALKLAERDLEITEDQYPDSLAAWAARRDLGELLMALDRREDAITTLEPLLDDSVKAHPATYALAQAISGQARRDQGESDQALSHLRAAVETEPEAPLRGLAAGTDRVDSTGYGTA